MLEAIRSVYRSLFRPHKRRDMRTRKAQLANTDRGLEMAEAKIAELKALRNIAQEAGDQETLDYVHKRLVAFRNLQADYQVTLLEARRR